MIKKIMKYKKQLLLSLISLFSINWMYLSVDKMNWKEMQDKFPVVKYKINPKLIGFNTGEETTIIETIRKSADVWSFHNSESRFLFTYAGLTTEPQMSVDEMKCDYDSVQALKQKEGIVFASNEEGDCSAESCTYIWSCVGKPEIVHFDIEINANDYEWETGTQHKKAFNLFTVMAKQFGHVLGLASCQYGLSTSLCNSLLSNAGSSVPTEDSLMYSISEPERIKTNLSLDDKQGLDSLYGLPTTEEKSMRNEMISFKEKADAYCVEPCVTPDKEVNAKYKLNDDEKLAIKLYWEELTEEGKNNKVWLLQKYYWIQRHYFLSFSYNKKSAENHLLDVIDNFHLYQSDAIPEYYQLERILISTQISTKQRLLEEGKWELDTQFYKFTESELKILIAIRRKYIDYQ